MAALGLGQHKVTVRDLAFQSVAFAYTTNSVRAFDIDMDAGCQQGVNGGLILGNRDFAAILQGQSKGVIGIGGLLWHREIFQTAGLFGKPVGTGGHDHGKRIFGDLIAHRGSAAGIVAA